MPQTSRPIITPVMSAEETYQAGIQLGQALRSERKQPMLMMDLQINVERPFRRFRQYQQIKAGFLIGYTQPPAMNDDHE